MYVCTCVFIYLFYIVFIFNFLSLTYASKFQFSQALGHLSALIQSALSFCVPHPALCSTRLCLCFWILVFFHTQSIYSYFIFLLAVSPAISRCGFLFEILRVFFFFFFNRNIYLFRYFSFLF